MPASGGACRAGEEGASHPWGYLAGAVAEVARHDPRAAVADAAAGALLEIAVAHCASWDSPAWQVTGLRRAAVQGLGRDCALPHPRVVPRRVAIPCLVPHWCHAPMMASMITDPRLWCNTHGEASPPGAPLQSRWLKGCCFPRLPALHATSVRAFFYVT